MNLNSSSVLLCYLFPIIFPDVCNARGMTPQNICSLLEELVQHQKDNPEETDEDFSLWVSQHMDEKFPLKNP